MERARIIVKGDVQIVGFRGFVIKQMKSLKLKGGADNLPDGTVKILCEGEKDRIKELIAGIKETPPHFAGVDSVEPEWQGYIGDLKEPERGGEDVPKKGATLDDLLKVMQSFDNKAEILNERVGDVASNTMGIISNTEDMATTLRGFRKESGEKQDQMLDKQDQMLDMQKQTVEKLDSFHHDTIQKFDTMDVKYDKVSDKLDKIDKTLDRLTNAILKLAEKSAE